MDQMVLKVQQWLNKTYNGKDGYIPIKEDGTTGWATTNALLVALQIEEGVPAWAIEDEIRNKSFGFRGMTVAKCPTVGLGYENPTNIVYILQGAFWCKGINPFAFDGKFTQSTVDAIEKLQIDAGIDATGIAHVLEFKALLSMDQYSLIPGGDPQIRQIQQTLNSRYAKDRGELIPCDGVYGAGLNRSLVYALQRLEGFSVDICNRANGYFGSGTADRCPTLSYGSSNSQFIELLQWCLYCNKCNPGGFGGIYDTATQDAVELFQKELALPGTPGVADINVWESLLISCGNKNRSARACDTATTLTYASAKALKDAGYDVVGRYLTNKFAMTTEEINNIFKAGLEIFAIYEYGSTLSYYSESGRGTKDGEAARDAALALGIPAGTVLYFAIDYDMEDYQVTNVVIPYFEEINNVIAPYSVGIYGSRNVCSRVSESGLAVSSFVLDMSTGYSGNLGYTMPDNWNFDQFATVTAGGVGIDKDGYKPTKEFEITFNNVSESIKSMTSSDANNMNALVRDVRDLFGFNLTSNDFFGKNNAKATIDLGFAIMTVSAQLYTSIDSGAMVFGAYEIGKGGSGSYQFSGIASGTIDIQGMIDGLKKCSSAEAFKSLNMELYNGKVNQIYFQMFGPDELQFQVYHLLKSEGSSDNTDVIDVLYTITVEFTDIFKREMDKILKDIKEYVLGIKDKLTNFKSNPMIPLICMIIHSQVYKSLKNGKEDITGLGNLSEMILINAFEGGKDFIKALFDSAIEA